MKGGEKMPEIVEAKNKVVTCDMNETEINFIIQREFQTGWTVKQIIYVPERSNITDGVIILFERS